MNSIARPVQLHESQRVLYLLVLANKHFRAFPRNGMRSQHPVSLEIQKALAILWTADQIMCAMTAVSNDQRLTQHGVNCATRIVDDIITKGAYTDMQVMSMRSAPCSERIAK